MSIMFSVSTSEALRPDPDENSSPILTLEPSDLVSGEKTLDTWSKVTLTRAGKSISGWLDSTNLTPVQQTTIKLFDEPLGNLLQTVTGRIDVIARVATWAKVKVTQVDGSAPLVGWTRRCSAVPPPLKPAGEVPTAGAAPPHINDDLVLGPNERYRPVLLQAQSITQIDAASLAALIDAEAAKISEGPDAGVWDPKSHNAGSGASGLTQFIESTWCDMACRTGTFLNKEARQGNMVTTGNQIAPNMRDQLLALRFQPELSIITAAEYGLSNLKALIKDQLVDSNIGDDERAWYIYLSHHED